ncbi:alpha/beta hydrolase [Actinophytocola sp.]|uniref:alpha/beta hydrolase n=1 Tax=Actinophytocola sp. TaxID=1872138 RepID=UPI002D4F0180|nr:alpha/beta hydrolase [Actinophytocola sp.]HYQ61904.1 alpha/beta hydrolase [Actinophytocola sp.]
MKRGSVLLAALLISGFATATTTAAAAPAVGWTPCAPESPVDCATITVPIDYAHPATGTIDLAIARIRATGEKEGTLVYMPGGPGDSGVNRLLRGNVVPPAVAARFDVVSYDPRGTNRSNPVVCDATLVENMPEFTPEAGTRLADVQEYARDLGNSCRQHTGPLVDHVDNVSVARDIDSVRAALGERKITLYGRSYGTLAGQMYVENFPQRVRGLVLDSVFDHSLDPTRFAVTEARTGEDAFGEFAKWCATDASCVLHGQDVGQVYGDLFDRAVRGELPVPAFGLVQGVLNTLYGPRWADTATLLQGLSTQAMRAAAEPEPFPLASFCTDHRVRISSQGQWEAMWRKQSAVAPTMRTHFAFAALTLCSAWPAETPNPQHRTHVDRSAPPVLILNSLHDPATGYEWALSVNRQLDRSVLLTYDGWGHGVTDRTDCTRAVFTDYVQNGRTPRPGTHCAAA